MQIPEKLVYYPDETLTKVCEPVVDFDQNLKDVVLKMIDLMYENNGVGLAAPQVGINKRFFIADPSGGEKDGELRCFVNPKIVGTRGEVIATEGCLSLPNAKGLIKRAAEVRVEYQDLEGGAQVMTVGELMAVIIQHEYDHLDGILFIDRVNRHERRAIVKKMRVKKHDDEAIRA